MLVFFFFVYFDPLSSTPGSVKSQIKRQFDFLECCKKYTSTHTHTYAHAHAHMQADSQCMQRSWVRCGGGIHIYIGYIHMYRCVWYVPVCIYISFIKSSSSCLSFAGASIWTLQVSVTFCILSNTFLSLSLILFSNFVLLLFFFVGFFVRLFCIFFLIFLYRISCWKKIVLFLVFVCKINLVAVRTR